MATKQLPRKHVDTGIYCCFCGSAKGCPRCEATVGSICPDSDNLKHLWQKTATTSVSAEVD